MLSYNPKNKKTPVSLDKLLHQAKNLCSCSSLSFSNRRYIRALESKAQELENKARELESEATSLEIEDYIE
jgi:hypothetical protein